MISEAFAPAAVTCDKGPVMSMYIAEPPLQILFWKILSPPAFLEQFTDFLVTKSDVR